MGKLSRKQKLESAIKVIQDLMKEREAWIDDLENDVEVITIKKEKAQAYEMLESVSQDQIVLADAMEILKEAILDNGDEK